jgi:hypothetical protein
VVSTEGVKKPPESINSTPEVQFYNPRLLTITS